MVLPETWSAVLALLIVAAFCFVLWPNLFKVAGSDWRFELFSVDFALGSVLLALIAAYTLGSVGSDLGFTDSMLVAGRRAQVMAFGAGIVFALANMLYLGTIALLGLSNATLLTFSVLGCALGVLRLIEGQYLIAASTFLVLAAASALTFLSSRAAREAVSATTKSSSAKSRDVQLSTKGTVTGILAGVILVGVVPVLGQAQSEEFGIGAYGGMLMATIGMVVATLLLNFFFMNISLEGGRVSYSNYLSASVKNHAIGIVSGMVWTVGALCLYAAKTSPAKVSGGFEVWSSVFGGALVTIISGIIVWQRVKLPPSATRNKFLAVGLFVVGVGVLLFGLRSA